MPSRREPRAHHLVDTRAQAEIKVLHYTDSVPSAIITLLRCRPSLRASPATDEGREGEQV